MKKSVATLGSILFMFSFYFVTVVLLVVYSSQEFWWILFGTEVATTFFAFYTMLNKKRRMETRIRWAVFLIFIPIFGIATYLFFGRVYHYDTNKEYKYKNFSDFGRKTEEQKLAEVEATLDRDVPEFKRAFMMARNEQKELIYQNTSTELLANGNEAWPRLLTDLNNAKKYILMNMYIIEDGELYRNFVQVLKNKIAAGVRVYIIFDYIGCYAKFTRKMKKELTNMGVNLVAFSPLIMPFINWTANYRDHRKDFSIDGKVGYIGGMNLTDEYINLSKKYGFWNDAMVRVSGEAVQGIEKIFASDWKFVKKGKEKITDWEPEIGALNSARASRKDLVQIVSTGPNHVSPMHLDLLLNLVGSAQKRIWLSTPYFVPPVELIKSLASAAKSGIDVRIVLPGMTDKAMLLDVSKRWTDELHDAGVKIYSMHNVFNHTKAFLFDDEISFVGSTNLDFRALFSDQQTMTLIKSSSFSKQLNARFEKDFETSFEYNFTPSREHNGFVRFIVSVYNVISPLL